MDGIQITDKMQERARWEARKRNKYIKHHFESETMTHVDRDIMGFLGEFAFCTMLGIDWELNIRDSYEKIDQFDVVSRGKKIDVKTSAIPNPYFRKLVNEKIGYEEPFSKRLINENQVPLLEKYDFVFWGIFKRDDFSQWYPLGYLPTNVIIENYEVVRDMGRAGRLPYPAIAIDQKDLLKYKYNATK
jgi:hypothetical protein